MKTKKQLEEAVRRMQRIREAAKRVAEEAKQEAIKKQEDAQG